MRFPGLKKNTLVVKVLIESRIKIADAKIVIVALEAIENIFRAGEEAVEQSKLANITNTYVDWFEELDGVSLLETVRRCLRALLV